MMLFVSLLQQFVKKFMNLSIVPKINKSIPNVNNVYAIDGGYLHTFKNAINQLPCTPSRGKPRKLPKYPSWPYKRIQIKNIKLIIPTYLAIR